MLKDGKYARKGGEKRSGGGVKREEGDQSI